MIGYSQIPVALGSTPKKGKNKMKLSPLKLNLAILMLLLASSAARSQDFVYRFYDGANGTGNLMATYTGPLIAASLNGTTTSGFKLNLAAITWSSPNSVPSTEFVPCTFQIGQNVLPDATIWIVHCSKFGTPYGTEQILFDFVTLPIGIGVYPTASSIYVYGFIGAQGTTSQKIQSVAIANVSPVPVYSCSGFQAPFDVALSLKSKTQRAIPVKMQLKDSDGNLVTDVNTGTAPPVVDIAYSSTTGPAIEETSLLEPLGQADPGNAFTYDSALQIWQYDLASSPFSASGTYTVKVTSGDDTKYSISPTCNGTFVRQ
jgi:hypothetical protein